MILYKNTLVYIFEFWLNNIKKFTYLKLQVSFFWILKKLFQFLYLFVHSVFFTIVTQFSEFRFDFSSLSIQTPILLPSILNVYTDSHTISVSDLSFSEFYSFFINSFVNIRFLVMRLKQYFFALNSNQHRFLSKY